MRIVDSSFIVEGLLKNKGLLEEDLLLTVDLALYGAANSVWKHQYLLEDLDDGLPYLSIVYGLVESGRTRIVDAGAELVEKTHSQSAKHRLPVHDTVYVALARELESPLGAFDKRQARLMNS